MERETKELASIARTYTGYRQTVLGKTLIASIVELREKYPNLSESLAQKILYAFDLTVPHHLEASSKARVTLTARQLKSYACLDHEWILKLKNVEVRESYQIAKLKNVTVYAGPSKGVRMGTLGDGGY